MSSSRRSEIEAKRARIAEMRKAREALQQQEAQRNTANREDIDQLVDSLVTTKLDDDKSPEPGSFTVVIADAYEQTPSVPAQPPAARNDTVASSASTTSATSPLSYSKAVQTDFLEDEVDLESEVIAADTPHSRPSTAEKPLTAGSEPREIQIPAPEEDILVTFAEPSAAAPEDLLPFVEQSIKVVERASKPETFDILTDYGSLGTTALNEESLVTQNLQFGNADTDARAVLDLAWSHAFPELVVVSYTEKRGALTEAKGSVKVWNTHMPDKPEYNFTADSDVTSVLCSPYHPTLVFGGLYNGQIMVWDMRASGSQPILASPLSGSAHAHPILDLDLYGTQNASSLVSASSDGTICTWSPDILAKPQEQIELQSTAEPGRNLTISPTALVTPAQDTSYFILGTEEGSLYHCNRYDKAGVNAGIDVRNSAQYTSAHLAPVTSLDLHPSKPNVDLGDYMLTSGFDWKIKLWRISTQSATAPESVNKPLLHTIYRDDTVYSTKWHPTCPSLFGAVDGSGHLEIYDLLADIDVPVVRVKPQLKTQDQLCRPLNRLAWDKTGKSAAVGGFDGIVTVFDMGNDLLQKSTPNEWKDVKILLNKIDTY